MLRTFADNHTIYPVGFGAMPLSVSGRPTEQEAFRVVEAFLKAGGNFIDTANVYGLDAEDKGHNERLLHKALKQFGSADKVTLATKGGGTRPNGGWDLRDGHPKKLRLACEESLQALGISAHQLYYLHGPDPEVPLEESLYELLKLQQEGKIIHIGVANVTLVQAKSCTQIAKIQAIQNRLNPFCKIDLHNGLVEFCRQHAISYIPYCPLGGWQDHAKLADMPFYQTLKVELGISSYELSLAWVLSKGAHIIPIPGMDKVEQVHVNLGAAGVILSQEVIAVMDGFPDLYQAVHQHIV